MKTNEITKEGPDLVLKAYAELVSKNSKIYPADGGHWQDKGKLSRQAGALYAKEICAEARGVHI